MAKFLTTTRISAELEDIIKNADDYLYLISPFLKVSKRLKELLESKSRSVNIHVIYGKSELQPDEGEWLQRLDTVRTSYRKDLHAKCYLNEDTALLTSMNLYEFSEKNNDEMGVLVSREDDEDLYNEIFKESKAILDKSEQVRMTFTRDEPVEDSEEQPRAKSHSNELQAPRRTASASGAETPYRQSRIVHTVSAASRVGIGSRTRLSRRSTATLAAKSTRRPWRSPCV